MSAFEVEYKQRKLKVKGVLQLDIESTGFMTQDFTHLENVLTDMVVDTITKYLSEQNTVEIIDVERSRTNNL